MPIVNNYCTTPYCLYAYCIPTSENPLFTQVRLMERNDATLGFQIRMVAYNITQLRILWEIASDGITANNFTASSEASTDKGVLNLKSDIVEKYWQTDTDEDEYCTWDVGAGRTSKVDTFGLFGHNLTSSATVTIKGYGTGADAAPGDWSVVPVYATITMPDDPDEDKLLWIAQTLPSTAYRHWRLDLDDPTNTDGFIRIGRLVAGSALIFSGDENCLDEIDKVTQSFKDEMDLNGFSRISNNRALKNAMTIRFRNLDRISKGNYRLLRRYIAYNRDTLKALVIVDPSDETSIYQFAVFAKLRQMPREGHKYIDANSSYTTLDLEFDEAR